jgi:phosphatidylglycerol lysyltransferase
MAEKRAEPPSASARELVARLAVDRGVDAMSFLAVESQMLCWRDALAAEGTSAGVAYVDTSTAWVAACSPLTDAPSEARAEDLSGTALRFVQAARAHGRRACFFGAEALAGEGLSRLLIGEQPIFRPRDWLPELPRRRRLREQLRRARAKGLQCRELEAREVRPGAPLRREIERLAAAWLSSRHIEPMGFLVALEPFHHPSHHRYFVAQLKDRVVGFLSAVPIAGRDAWLVEDVLRSPDAPNGTSETLLVALMHALRDSAHVTLGLTPLSGAVTWPLRVARWVSRPLFDFEGLRAFRERLRPDGWEPVWLVYPKGQPAAVAVVDSLRAFAQGSLVAFAVRSFARHPSGLPWVLALPLPLWVTALGCLVATGGSALLGLHPFALALWVAFDVFLLVALVRAAMRPVRGRMLLATSLAVGDAIVSMAHLLRSGPGGTPAQILLRTLAVVAPIGGAVLLTWASTRVSRSALPNK